MQTITDTLNIHFDRSFQMLSAVMDACPAEFWAGTEENNSIWKRVLHVLESIDYRLTVGGDYLFPELFTGFSAEMDQISQSVVSKEKMSGYRDLMSRKITRFFEMVNDGMLLERFSEKATFLDIILTQIRHIQNNVGYCSELLRRNGGEGMEWLGYRER